MPQIREYTAENDVLRPTETGIDATAQGARRVGAFYSQAGETEKRSAEDLARAAEARARAAGALATEEKARFGTYGDIAKATGSALEMAENYAGHQEIGHAAANMAQATQQLTEQWNGTFDAQAKSDPNNASIQKGYMQGTFEPWAQKFVAGFNTPLGQDWANEQVDRLRNHLFEKTTADMSTMAGLAVKSNLDKMSSSWENTARADPSPHNIDFLLKQADDQINAVISTSPNLKGVAAARLQTEYLDTVKRGIVRAGALGGIEQSGNPEAAAADYTKRYSDYLDPQETDNVSKAARTYRRAAEIDADRLERKQNEEDNKLSKTTRQEYVDDLYAPYAGGTQTKSLKSVLEDPRLKNPEDKEHLINLFVKAEKGDPPADVSHRAMANLLPLVRDGQYKSITDVPKEQINKLDHSDYKILDEEIETAKSPGGRHINELKKIQDESVKRIFERSASTANPDAYYRWNEERTRRMDQLRSKPGGNPNDVFDSSKPDYMGGSNVINQFRRPLAGRIGDNGGISPSLPATFKDRFQATGPEAPPAKFYNGKWYVRGPNGESVEAK